VTPQREGDNPATLWWGVFEFDLQGVPEAQNAAARWLVASADAARADATPEESSPVELGSVGKRLVQLADGHDGGGRRSIQLHGFAPDADPVTDSSADMMRCDKQGRLGTEQPLWATTGIVDEGWMPLISLNDGAVVLHVNWTDTSFPFDVEDHFSDAGRKSAVFDDSWEEVSVLRTSDTVVDEE
jgi:hypothetical protein